VASRGVAVGGVGGGAVVVGGAGVGVGHFVSFSYNNALPKAIKAMYDLVIFTGKQYTECVYSCCLYTSRGEERGFDIIAGIIVFCMATGPLRLHTRYQYQSLNAGSRIPIDGHGN
jgi:hypothetical protein